MRRAISQSQRVGQSLHPAVSDQPARHHEEGQRGEVEASQVAHDLVDGKQSGHGGSGRDEQDKQQSGVCPSRKEYCSDQKGPHRRECDLQEPERIPGEFAHEPPIVPGLFGVKRERQGRAEKHPL